MDPVRFFPLLSKSDVCPGCDASVLDALHVYPLKQNKRRVTRQLHVALLGCERCGIVFSHPLPSDAELDIYYGGGDGWQARIPESPDVVARALVRRKDDHSADLALVACHVATPDPSAGRRPKALDFGCGIGGWLGARRGRLGYLRDRARAESSRDRARAPSDPRRRTLRRQLRSRGRPPHPRAPPRSGRHARATSEGPERGGAIWISVPNLETLGTYGDFNYVAND